ncbi:MAG: hypothetical protein WEB30_02300, partial [Cyclobacteriaceae bacterium]
KNTRACKAFRCLEKNIFSLKDVRGASKAKKYRYFKNPLMNDRNRLFFRKKDLPSNVTLKPDTKYGKG